MSLKFSRILIKLSGEALMGDQSFGHDRSVMLGICQDIKEAYDLGCQVCIVVGGGNIFRGSLAITMGIERTTADHMGMLATCINALAMQSMIEQMGIPIRMQSSIPMTAIAEQYIRRRAIRHMEKGRIVIFSAGTGHPFFTTDTAASLRAAETNCKAIFKATQVDGVYSSDPKKDFGAQKYSSLSYKDVMDKDLRIMDTAAISLAKENKIPILVFNIRKRGEIARVLTSGGEYSIIS
ncbi:Uridylate kinase [Candidatus Cyrtobacter comes]|uniref:Uridylate kinase n=1 Tax=Candidatus Cyrtobacter comes TaxID=675776 RepID=A0ABU5L8I9_9RICK|nr:UMP kinase [Candidatus Cyrtobacter comes]MDZ5762432.1 Uridylate kinase [Candidatus Cyrtobacter comes]